MSLHLVRRRRSSKLRWILFDEEFPTGDHELHFHEACFFQSSSTALLEIYEDRIPEEPKKQRTGRLR